MRCCCYCGSTAEELRPYGPAGADVCFECAMATPEREAQTAAAFGAILGGAQVMGGGTATITDHGIEPGLPEFLQILSEPEVEP